MIWTFIILLLTLRVVRSLPSSSLDLSSPSTSTTTNTDTIVTLTSTTTSTVTAYITVSSTPPPSSSSTTTTTSSATFTTRCTSWAMPAMITSIAEAFNVTRFADDQRNLQAVNEDDIPSDSSSSDPSTPSNLLSILIPVENDPDDDPDDDDDDDAGSDTLQVFYPRGSINPSNSPFGGAQFYASPIDISTANNVSFAYNVFFPLGFDFVKGGKLPGLYGGHSGCSGGDAALSCFSTRLMWRTDGMGELYLYAPKDKQTAGLCSEPHSACESTYGISIGRGTWNFTRGEWTHVSQTVVLNTPGIQDGCFTLDVNGERVIDRHDVFYRDNPPFIPQSVPVKAITHKDKTKSRKRKSKHYTHAPQSRPTPPVKPYRHSKGGLLGGLLGGRDEDLEPTADELFIEDDYGEAGGIQAVVDDSGVVNVQETFHALNAAENEEETIHILGVDEASPGSNTSPTSPPAGPVEFTGMFFSTFFGGHTPDWASPRDQYVWFKDFSMVNNT